MLGIWLLNAWNMKWKTKKNDCGRRRKMIVEKDDKRIPNETYMVKAL